MVSSMSHRIDGSRKVHMFSITTAPKILTYSQEYALLSLVLKHWAPSKCILIFVTSSLFLSSLHVQLCEHISLPATNCEQLEFLSISFQAILLVDAALADCGN